MDARNYFENKKKNFFPLQLVAFHGYYEKQKDLKLVTSLYLGL